MIPSRLLGFAVAALLIGCGESEPRAWEMDGYEAGDKPVGIEYLYCETADTLVQVFPDELRLTLYEYGTTEIFAASRTAFNNLPEPKYVEHQTEVTKYSAESSTYSTSEIAKTALVDQCGEVALFSEVYFGPGDEERGYVGSLIFQRRFRDVRLRDTFACGASASSIQRDLEWKARFENDKFDEKKSVCKFMPDTKSFLAERDLFREQYSQLAASSKQRVLERIEEEEREVEQKMEREKEAGADRI